MAGIVCDSLYSPVYLINTVLTIRAEILKYLKILDRSIYSKSDLSLNHN